MKGDTEYFVRLAAQNKYGRGDFSEGPFKVKTLNWSPTDFVPAVSLKGQTWNSMTIGWTSPTSLSYDPEAEDEAREAADQKDYLDFIHHYKLTRKSDDQTVISR